MWRDQLVKWGVKIRTPLDVHVVMTSKDVLSRSYHAVVLSYDLVGKMGREVAAMKPRVIIGLAGCEVGEGGGGGGCSDLLFVLV